MNRKANEKSAMADFAVAQDSQVHFAGFAPLHYKSDHDQISLFSGNRPGKSTSVHGPAESV